MRLIYTETGTEVKVGDVVETSKGDKVVVTYFRQPHKPSSSGHVSVTSASKPGSSCEFYVSVIGAEWIEREDRIYN